MSKGFNMLREYIENDALCMRRGKCCDFEYELQKEFAALEAENAELRYKVHILEGGNKGLQILNDSLKANNAELRELLHDAAIELYVNGNVTDGATELLFDQMRELGIEVG